MTEQEADKLLEGLTRYDEEWCGYDGHVAQAGYGVYLYEGDVRALLMTLTKGDGKQ